MTGDLHVTLRVLPTGWGEVTPRWLPFIGGKRVPPLAAIIPAAVGSVALTLLWVSVFSSIGEIFDEYGLTGTARTVVIACYAPLLLWGPLLGTLTVSYARRTLGPGRSAPAQRGAALCDESVATRRPVLLTRQAQLTRSSRRPDYEARAALWWWT